MNYVFVFFLFFSCNLSAQKVDTLKLNGGPINVSSEFVINGSVSCDYDTLIKIHENALFVISDSNSFNQDFQKGEKKYFEMIIKTKKCRCRDCSWTKRIIIECTNLKDKDPFIFNFRNSTWISWTSWSSRPKIESEIKGELIKDGNSFHLKLEKYFSKEHLEFILETIELKNLQVKQ